MNKKGFTLVEVLIALSIAVIAGLTAAQIVARTNRVVHSGRNTFVATNIAHEGLELTRALRDNTWFFSPNRQEWLSTSGICDEGSTDTKQFTISPDRVRNEKIVGEEGGEDATIEIQNIVYTRTLEANCEYAAGTPGPAEDVFVTITSKVTWQETDGSDNEVSLTERLYNWLPVL